ncbi:lipid-A-disaccharide synthase [uncultured Cocleimonas sp.]|uniref:lipid-A-disaccharide synthase n=1 Tax=uncultured Cocleimonas sp. TaxID=1051587 RepID=UPI00261A60DB|nr:lipid-A-disaccharide synthase [uncultured Cocleimonas sp.]
MRIAIIAGEASGDILGARLIEALKVHYPQATFEGIAGKEMQQAGCTTMYAMDRLSLMGFSEVLPRYLELTKLRNRLIKDWIANPPDLLVGIDAPDFNLKIEKKLYQAGIPAVHYVSPSFWAWREGRVKKMVNAMSLMLTLFPFEVDFYKKHGIKAEFTGHPLADEIPVDADPIVAREQLGLANDAFILAVLPGSRMGEIKRIAPDFLKGLKLIYQKHPDWTFVSPLINEKVKQEFDNLKQEIAPEVPITYIDGQSRLVMQAADQILMASGTAVLEGMLVGRPMVAAYRVTPTTAKIIRLFNMIKSKYYTLPNNLANEFLVPELIQEDITADKVFHEVEQQFLQDEAQRNHMLNRFDEIHKQLSQDASKKAAQAIYNLLQDTKAEGANS